MRALMLFSTMLLGGSPVGAQVTRWTVEPAISLAWWQMNPHMNHLWATTCPQEPSWRPGEDQISGPGNPPTGYANVIDTVIPRYPRPWVLPLCEPAVRGEIVTDSAAWNRTRGLIIVRSEALTIGQPLRDEYARRAILDVARYPDIRFQVDSLLDLVPGDTLSAKIAGIFEFRGQKHPVTATARAWRHGEGLRITARFDIPPEHFSERYGVSKMALGLGVGQRLWKMLHAGVDLVLKPAP